MSLVQLHSPLLSVAPSVWIENGDVLCARTSRVWQALSLGSYVRDVRFDRRARTVTIRTRYAFFAHSETVIPYARLLRIEYRFGSVGTGFFSGGYRRPNGWLGRSERMGHTSDQLEYFTIELVLQNPFERVEGLFFAGEGARMTGAFGVLMGDSVVDLAGEQEKESLEVFDLIERFTGVGPSGRVAGVKLGDEPECPVCNTPYGPKAERCIYCGLQLAKTGPTTGK